MLRKLKLNLVRAVFDVATKLVNRRTYQARVAAVLEQDQKHEGFDLKGWEYLKRTCRSGVGQHRFYRYGKSSAKKPTILFLHGLNLDGRNFLGMAPLAEDYQLIAYDFPEKSEWYHGEIDDFSGLLIDFIELMELEAIHLVGVSFGGIVAIKLGGQCPERFESISLISSRIPGYHEDDRYQLRVIDEMLSSYEDYQIYWILTKLMARHFKGLDAEEAARTRSVLRIKNIDYFRQVASSTRAYNGRDDAQRIGCPALLLLGTEDELMPLESLVDFRESIARPTIRVIEGAGHDMSLTSPEMVCACLREFLSTLDPTPDRRRSRESS